MDAAASSNVSGTGVRLGWRLTPFRLIAALTVLALALRLLNLGGRNLWLDEAFSAWFSQHSFHYLWTVLPTYEAHPPFYYSLLKLWRSLFGDSALALRALSVVLGTLTVPVLIAAALEQERQEPSGQPIVRAGLAGFLGACSPMLMFIGQEARPYALLAFAYALAILALLRLMRQFKAGEPGSWSNWMLMGGAAELTAWSHGLGILYAACLAVALLPAWVRPCIERGRIIRGTTTATIFAALYLPCLLMMKSRAGDWGTNWLAWRPSMFLQLVSLYSVPFEILTVGSALAAFGMILLLKRSLDAAIATRRWNIDATLAVLWLGPPLLAALISWLIVPVFLARTLSATLVPAYLAIGSGIVRSENARERRIIVLAICIVLTPLAVVLAERPAAERWDQAAAYLSRKVSPQDQLWLYPSDSALPLSRVTRIPGTIRHIPAPFPTLGVKGPIRAGWPAMVSVTPAQAERLARDPELSKVPVVWLLTRQSGIFDPDNDMPKALSNVRRPGRIESWGYISVQPFYVR
ncbi:MAG: glycosyltransferase family 39 protein [Sphingomicrobium sp.]